VKQTGRKEGREKPPKRAGGEAEREQEAMKQRVGQAWHRVSGKLLTPLEEDFCRVAVEEGRRSMVKGDG
jgi:hypothetical protein